MRSRCPLEILAEGQRAALAKLVRVHGPVILKLQLIIALRAATLLTLTLVLTEVVMMRLFIMLVIDTDKSISSCQLLVELFLGRDELHLVALATGAALLAVRAHLLTRCSLERHSLVEHGRVRLAGHRLQSLIAGRFLTIGSQQNTSIFHPIFSCLVDTDPTLPAVWIEILSTVRHVTLMVVLMRHHKACLTAVLLPMNLYLIDEDR